MLRHNLNLNVHTPVQWGFRVGKAQDPNFSDEKISHEKIIYDAFEQIKEKTGKDPVEVFNAAMENIMPLLEVKSRRVGGSNYQVPIEVRADRRQTLGLRWLVNYSKNRSGRGMANKLANEIMDAANGSGASVKKKDDTHKMAEANKAFAHYRW